MVWARSDDQFPEHPKVWPLSDGAYRLHSAGMCKAAGLLTNGVLADSRIPGLTPTFKPKYLTELEAAGLWHPPGHTCDCEQPPPGHHVIHDFLDYNPSKEKVEKGRAESALRQKKWRESQRDETRDKQRESHPPRPDPARRATGRVSEEPLASDPPTPDAFGGVGSLPPEVVKRNVEQARAARQALRPVLTEEAS